MRVGLKVAGLVLATVAWSGCTDDSRSASVAAEVADSAGVRIVSNPPGSLEAVASWSLSADPVVWIGAGANPDLALYQVTAVLPLENGGVAVGTGIPPRVSIFDADGIHAATLGREGRGPGEFSTVTSVVPLGPDSLAVWDQNRRHVSIYSRDGRFLRELDLSALAPLSPMAVPNASHLAAFTSLLPSTSGSFVLFGVGVFGPGAGVRRVEVPAYRITADGEELASYGPYPGMEIFHSGQGGPLPFPFAADTYGAAAGDALVVGTAAAPEFRVYGPTGALQRIVRWPDHDRTVGGPFLSDWTDFVDDWLSGMPADQRDGFRGAMDAVPPAERFPAYDGLLAGDRGEIWVGTYAGQYEALLPPRNAPVPARRWLVFGDDGALVGGVRTPEGFQPFAVRDGRVWGVFQDELEVESVQAYEVFRP